MNRGGKRALAALAVLFLLLAGAVITLPPLLFGDGVDYSQVASIQKTPAYQDASLMERAWQLPVAATLKAGMEYQHNGSFCGPASAVVVAHSLGAAVTQADVLDGTAVHSTLGIVFGGVSLDELAGVLRDKLPKQGTVLRDLDLAQFRAELAHA